MDNITTTDLMQPRYKVIADWPTSPFEVGVILVEDKDGEMHSIEHGYPPSNKSIFIEEANKYPHLFTKLEWWEERKVENMPKYVKDENEPGEYEIFKVEKWEFLNGQPFRIAYHNHAGGYSVTYLLPATEAEYNEYQKQATILK